MTRNSIDLPCGQKLGTFRTGRFSDLFVALAFSTSLCFAIAGSAVWAQGQGAESVTTSATEVIRRNTAVTLNYCRAALHRIRRAPS
ncbi:MAG TPA: hypothetical protein PLY87_20845, partial [Planctomycetaceae bacterium]|nr:hypothetical protein [Planctomycetaceae bacterium]